MPVPSAITDLSQTAGSNSPSGSESPITADDYLRTLSSFIALLRDGKGHTGTATLASAATTDIGAQNSLFAEITGTTTITSFGTTYNGPRFLRFAGALTLTHNATTLNLPGAANITTATGDTCVVVPNSAANGWNVLAYQKASGLGTAAYLNVGTSANNVVQLDGSAKLPAVDGSQLTNVGSSQLQPISASVAASALTISASALSLDFRSTTLGSGTVTRVSGTPSNLVISSGSTLGTTSAVQSDIAVLAINNAGTIELAAVNISGGVDLSETGLISTTAEGGAGAADSATVIYSTTARTNVAYRVIGVIRSTQATAGTWATAPSLIQGIGGLAFGSIANIKIGTPVATTSGTSVDITGIPASAKRVTVVLNGVSTNGTSPIMLRIGSGSIDTTGYNAFGFGFTGASVSGVSYTTGFGIQNSAVAADGHYGPLTLTHNGSNLWVMEGSGSCGTTATGFMCAGTKSLSGTLDRVRITTSGGTDTFDAGSLNIIVE